MLRVKGTSPTARSPILPLRSSSATVCWVWDDLPENVDWLYRQLLRGGFVEVGRMAGPMDSGLITMRHDPVEIRLVKDRSQWSVDLMADGWTKDQRVPFPLFHGFALDE